MVRSALNSSPGAFIAVIGCYAQLKPEEIAKIDGVDLVLGAAEKFNLAKYLQPFDKKESAEIHSCEIQARRFRKKLALSFLGPAGRVSNGNAKE